MRKHACGVGSRTGCLVIQSLDLQPSCASRKLFFVRLPVQCGALAETLTQVVVYYNARGLGRVIKGLGHLHETFQTPVDVHFNE